MSVPSTSGQLSKRVGIPVETFVWKRIDSLELCADIFYPPTVAKSGSKALPKRPIALLLHGGAHFLLTRKEVPMKHIKTLLKRGYLPVSVDYSLCPEQPLIDGAIPDVIDALRWVRSSLPGLQRARLDVQMDCNKVMAVGWSSGGHLAMILGYTAAENGVQPPEVVVGFYSMCDFEADFWKRPINFMGIKEPPYSEDDLLKGVGDKPTAGYSPTRVAGVARNPVDPAKSPRALFPIHCFCKAQMVPVLIHGLPTRAKARALRAAGVTTNWMDMPQPPAEAIQRISPYAQILAGRYRTPTFLAHGDNDQELPIEQSRDTIAALRACGVEAGFAAAHGAGHSFDFRPDEDPLGTAWGTVQEAYDWAGPFVGL
ncbi:hypothetical protein MMC17_006636 [Xylographa soralifera]|nr:hypothetical protein [Xylographa soralifera]